MNEPEAYLLDANVFIEAAPRYYAFDVVPGSWAGLEQLPGRGASEVSIASGASWRGDATGWPSGPGPISRTGAPDGWLRLA